MILKGDFNKRRIMNKKNLYMVKTVYLTKETNRLRLLMGALTKYKNSPRNWAIFLSFFVEICRFLK